MNKYQRPTPYQVGSERRRKVIDYYMRYDRLTYREALARVVDWNRRIRNTPLRGEKCGAKTRKGTPCQCKALSNGRCKYHGGLSTGPKTEAGKRKSAANLPRQAANHPKVTPRVQYASVT